MNLKKKKCCLVAFLILIVIPLLCNFLYFSQNNISLSLKNIFIANFTYIPLIIANILSVIIAIILCSIKKIFSEMEIINKFEEELKPYKMLLESSPAIVVQADIKGRFKYVNEAFEKISGYSRDEIIGKMHISELYKGGMSTAKEIFRIMRTPEKGGISIAKSYSISFSSPSYVS